jgi:hypothetical protein
MKGHAKANQKNIKGNARLKNCLSPFKSTKKKTCLTYQMKGKKRKGLPLTIGLTLMARYSLLECTTFGFGGVPKAYYCGSGPLPPSQLVTAFLLLAKFRHKSETQNTKSLKTK